MAVQERKLVVDPHLGFAEIDRALGKLGFRTGDSALATPPLIPGEPELADWVGDGATIHYTFNPVVRFRLLSVAGDAQLAVSADIRANLPCLKSDDIETLVGSDGQRQVLLGLYAAAETNCLSVLPKVQELRTHTSQRVSAAAARTAEKLGLAFVEAGAEQIAARQRRHPGRSALFEQLSSAEERREVLLWLLHDQADPAGDAVKVLRSGLADENWRVRVTAMLVAARMGCSDAWLDVRRMELPGSSERELDRHWRDLLRGLRAAVLDELSGAPVKPSSSDAAKKRNHLRRIVSADSTDPHDPVATWVQDWLARPVQRKAGPA
ncbi:MAG: hypothetical protein QNJ40_12150 [Xanthomonadales bacterium]|nr:hypothetical protein [Xanthomonadales bacterium]